MKLQIPPHIAWPAFVVLILLVGIGGAFSIFYFAAQDGGAQIIDDYYAQASNWDATMHQQAASAALGWTAAVAVEPQHTHTNGLRAVVVTVTDRDGAPVADLRGTLQALRPQLAQPVAEVPLQPSDVPGAYRLLLPIQQVGLWDFHLVALRGADRFETTVRLQVSG